MINGAHTRTDVEAVSIADIFKIDSNKTLVWDGFLPDGRKKQRWEDGALNWDLHLKGIKKQGGNLAYKNAVRWLGRCRVMFVFAHRFLV